MIKFDLLFWTPDMVYDYVSSVFLVRYICNIAIDGINAYEPSENISQGVI